MSSEEIISVEVCYVAADIQFLRTVRIPSGSTVLHAIRISGLQQELPDLNIDRTKVGIYSKLKTLDTALKANDRVEVYRPLQVDPMAARRTRANKK